MICVILNLKWIQISNAEARGIESVSLTESFIVFRNESATKLGGKMI